VRFGSPALTFVIYSNIFEYLVLVSARSVMEEPSGWHNFLEIVTKPDNIPIVGMLILVIFFTWLGLREAFKHDKLIDQGKEDEIPHEMWK